MLFLYPGLAGGGRRGGGRGGHPWVASGSEHQGEPGAARRHDAAGAPSRRRPQAAEHGTSAPAAGAVERVRPLYVIILGGSSGLAQELPMSERAPRDTGRPRPKRKEGRGHGRLSGILAANSLPCEDDSGLLSQR